MLDIRVFMSADYKKRIKWQNIYRSPPCLLSSVSIYVTPKSPGPPTSTTVQAGGGRRGCLGSRLRWWVQVTPALSHRR